MEKKAVAKFELSRLEEYTSEEILRELQRVASLVKSKFLTQSEFKKHAKVSDITVTNRFGNWEKALTAAGLIHRWSGRKPYSEAELFENLLTVWTHYGRQPTYLEMNTSPSKVRIGTYVKRWGTWRKALKVFINKANQDVEESRKADKIEQQEQNEQKIRNPKAKEDKRGIPLGLRYEVLKRDRFRCVIDGRSPATDPTCQLHVDHIIPFSKGGKTVIENLRTVCSECNLGKGSKLE